MTISPHDAIHLPVHDDAVLAVTFPNLEDGFDSISIKLRINSEESFDLFKKLGITSRELWLAFQNCGQITTDLVGYCSGREVISTFEIIESSEPKQKLLSSGLVSSNTIHFKIQGSHGSQFDILAKSISVAV